MQELNEVLLGLRDKFLGSVMNWLDPGYIILSLKTVPLSPEEQEFKEIYANTIVLHCTNILLTLPAGVYYYHYFRAQRRQPVDEAKLRWARRRLMVFMPLCLASMATAYTYEKLNNFGSRLREVEQFYLDHQEQDINEVRFEYKLIQNSPAAPASP